MLNQNLGTSKVEIWVTNKINKINIDTKAELLWSKSFTVDLQIYGNCFPGFICFLTDEGKNVNVYCNASFGTLA